MAYLGILEAIRSRLEGNSPKHVPLLPDLPGQWDPESPDRNDGGINRQAIVDAYLKKDRYMQVGRLRVPIFLFDYQGQRYENIYPSITYEILDLVPRYNEFVFQSEDYRGDEVQHYVKETTQDVQDILNANNVDDLGPFPRAMERRQVQHPLDVLVEIRAYANDPILSAILIQYLFEVFPPRHYLRVPMKDGTHRDWDLLFEGYKDLDKREAVRAGTPGVEREYAKVFTYRVEGYFDNTDTTELVNVVRKRIINFEPVSALPAVPPSPELPEFPD